MSDTVETSNNLTIKYNDPSGGDTITQMIIPDCKHGLTETEIKNYNYIVSSGYIKINDTTLKKTDAYTADETATEKINISLE